MHEYRSSLQFDCSVSFQIKLVEIFETGSQLKRGRNIEYAGKKYSSFLTFLYTLEQNLESNAGWLRLFLESVHLYLADFLMHT